MKQKVTVPFSSARGLQRLATPATSVQSECLFKIAKQTHTPERNRLRAKTLEDLLFCMFNLRFGGFAGPASLRPSDLKLSSSDDQRPALSDEPLELYDESDAE